MLLEPRIEALAALEAAENAIQAETDPLLSSRRSSHVPTPDMAPSMATQESIVFRMATAMLSFFVSGVHTGALGVLIPYMEPYYDIRDTMVSLLFVMPLIGYLVASFMNSVIHAQLGRRGIGFIASTVQLLVTIGVALHPPYSIVLVLYAIAGFGVGLTDAAWSAWAAVLPNANTVSGFLHGSYSFGATVGPGVTAFLLVGAELPWYSFYWALAATTAIQVVVITWAFRRDTAARYNSQRTQSCGHVLEISPAKSVWRQQVVWICAIYLLAYVGAENAIGGWLVTFMLRTRESSTSAASICISGFWAGMVAGRLALGPVTDRFGERLSVTVYLCISIAAGAAFCLLTPFPIVLGAITVMGFFLAPTFPTAMVVITRLLPQSLHVGAVATVAAVGQIGGAAFPFLLGTLAESLGIQAIQPFVFTLILIALISWLCFPPLSAQKRNSNDAEDME